MTAGRRQLTNPSCTPSWAYDEDGYCVCCGNGRWKYHMPDCELRDALDALAAAPSTEAQR